MTSLVDYFIRIAPGIAVTAVMLGVLPRAESGARLCVHLGFFVFVRDAMTPLGLWHIGERPVFWLRLARDPVVLLLLTAGMASLGFGVLLLERQLARRVVWLRGSWWRALLAGVIAAGVVAAAPLAMSFGTPVDARGGALPGFELAVLLVFSLVGNAYEELLFRGFLQGLMAERVGEARAALVSGVAFAFGHVSLATAVTNLGAPILVFTALEGLICGQLCRRMGLFPAAIAHGGGIFLFSSGLI